MGNQPSRKATGSKSSGKRPLKMVNGAKKSIQQKNIKRTVEIAVGGGLKSGGKNVLSTSLLAACEAYSQYKNNPSSDISKISYSSVSSTIKSSKSSMPRDGRSVLRSSISIALSSLRKNEKRR